MGTAQPLDFFMITRLGSASRFGLQLTVADQLLFPFDSGFQSLFAIRDPSRRGFEGDLIGLMLKL